MVGASGTHSLLLTGCKHERDGLLVGERQKGKTDIQSSIVARVQDDMQEGSYKVPAGLFKAEH